ncbi:hypothetical protein BD408DRAFT_426883 [Parasitella parasitica]|nr:hypothetical protein BD408DRAFT_426883 [Parasitella parasitica]
MSSIYHLIHVNDFHQIYMNIGLFITTFAVPNVLIPKNVIFLLQILVEMIQNTLDFRLKPLISSCVSYSILLIKNFNELLIIAKI